MSSRLNWEKAKRKKATRSLSDEREFMERDRAARWLEHQEQRQRTRSTKAPQPRPKPSIVGDKNRTRHCPGKVKVNSMSRRASSSMAGLQGGVDLGGHPVRRDD
jgi:hypothetical protein